jgi:hypothetical protein
MRTPLHILFIVLSVTGIAFGHVGQTGLKVCANPAAPCHSKVKRFEPYELSFRLPARIKPNVMYQSQPFYAVVLYRQESGTCDRGEYSSAVEAIRLRAQKRFPDQKVFTDHQCPDMGAVSYDVEGQTNAKVFIAVYAGTTKAEAERILAKAKPNYRKASLKRMRVAWSQIMQ